MLSIYSDKCIEYSSEDINLKTGLKKCVSEKVIFTKHSPSYYYLTIGFHNSFHLFLADYTWIQLIILYNKSSRVVGLYWSIINCIYHSNEYEFNISTSITYILLYIVFNVVNFLVNCGLVLSLYHNTEKYHNFSLSQFCYYPYYNHNLYNYNMQIQL